MTTGIYLITNKITNQRYIGASIEIEKRWRTHKTLCFNKKYPNFYNSPLYSNMRKYGIENFIFEILEIVPKEQLKEKEKYYIKLFNTTDCIHGLNRTNGGESVSYSITEKEVREIRIRYNNKERKKEVYEDYKTRINKTGFHKIWNGETWKNILPEVFTQENKDFHKHNTSSIGRSRLSEEDVKDIRERKKNFESKKIVYEDYKDKLTYRSFENIWYYMNWKNIIV